MTKPIAFPPCKGCDLKLPNKAAGPGKYWCHGRPPSSFIETVVTYPPGGGQPVPSKSISSSYPPVHDDMIGCALHPKVRAHLK